MLFETQIEDIRISKCHSFDFPYHLHSNTEILICTSGSFNIICNDKNKLLCPGDIMTALPGDVHAYLKTSGGEGIMIIFNPNISELISGLVLNNKCENFVTNKDVIPIAENFFKSFDAGLCHTVLYGYLHIIAGMILKPAQAENHCVNSFNSIIEYIACNYTNKISLKSISEHTGISQSHISRIFSAKVCGGFKNYINLMRVEKAKTLLKTTDKAICEIMYDSGFSDQCTFNRVFKEKTSLTPKAYRSQTKNTDSPIISVHNL